ncbi:unnamed protein product [Prunus armeniaca]
MHVYVLTECSHIPRVLTFIILLFLIFKLVNYYCLVFTSNSLAPFVGNDTKGYVVLLLECPRHPTTKCLSALLQSALSLRPSATLHHSARTMSSHPPNDSAYAFGTLALFGACDVFTFA